MEQPSITYSLVSFRGQAQSFCWNVLKHCLEGDSHSGGGCAGSKQNHSAAIKKLTQVRSALSLLILMILWYHIAYYDSDNKAFIQIPEPQILGFISWFTSSRGSPDNVHEFCVKN